MYAAVAGAGRLTCVGVALRRPAAALLVPRSAGKVPAAATASGAGDSSCGYQRDRCCGTAQLSTLKARLYDRIAAAAETAAAAAAATAAAAHARSSSGTGSCGLKLHIT